MNHALLALAILSAASVPALADTPAAAPNGWVRFCTQNASFCDRHDAASAPISMMPVLDRANRVVNDGVLPEALNTSDQRNAETRDWRVVVKGGIGACVEYSLTKEMLLSWAGIPEGAMRLAQVHRTQDAAGMFHMVLLVRVQGVEVVLDNLTPVIWPADKEQWDWIAVQDNTGANSWAWVKPDGAPK